MPPTVLLVTSNDERWTELRAAVRGPQGCRVVGDVQRTEEAVELAAEFQPDIVIVAADGADGQPLSLVQQLCVVSARSKIALVGPEETFEQATLSARWKLTVSSQVAWEHLKPALIPCWLAMVESGELFVGSRALINMMTTPSDARQGPRVEALLLTSEERRAARARSRFGPGSIPQATLWEGNPDLTAILRTVFALATIALDVVSTPHALLTAEQYAMDGDFLLIDCSHAHSDDMARCMTVVTRTRLPVYVVHPRADVVDGLRRFALGHVHWFDPAMAGLAALERLRLLKAQGALLPPRSVDHTLTDREREVWRLVAEGHTDKEIARRLVLGESTVRRVVAQIKQKVGLSERRELIRCYRRFGQALHSW